MNNYPCEICGKSYPEDTLIKGHGIRHEIERLLIADHPGWNGDCRICRADFDLYRVKYTTAVISEERETIDNFDKYVLKSIQENDLITSNANESMGGGARKVSVRKEPIKWLRLGEAGGSFFCSLAFCLYSRDSGAHHHDESEPAGGKGSNPI